MFNKVLFNMKLAESPNCLFRGEEESLVHAFLEYENPATLQRNIELCVRARLNHKST